MANLFTAKRESVAKAFRRYGWLAFWIQVILAAFTLFLSIYVLFFSKAASIRQNGMGLGDWFVCRHSDDLQRLVHCHVGARCEESSRRRSRGGVINDLNHFEGDWKRIQTSWLWLPALPAAACIMKPGQDAPATVLRVLVISSNHLPTIFLKRGTLNTELF